MPTRLRGFRWRRLGRVALYTIATVAVSYLLVANVLLRTRLLRNAINGGTTPFGMSGNSAGFEIDYRSAHSLLPGRVQLEGVTIRGRDRAVEWRLTLERADVTVSFAGLLQRTFRATRIRASGLTMRVRLRLSRADPSVVGALPPILGFADPPLLDIGPVPPPLTDADYNLWMADLSDVDVEHVREVWIHTLRLRGDTRVRGRWFFRPQQRIDIGPAIVDLNGVDMFFGKQPLARGLHGSFGATVHTFDIQRVDGLAILDHVSYDGRVRGRAIVAGALSLLAPRSEVNFTRWEPPFDARIVLKRGRLAAGTRVRTETTAAEVQTKGLTIAGRAHSEFGVAGGLVTLDTGILDLRVSELGSERARIASIAAAVTSRQLRAARIFEDARFRLDIGGAETSDIGNWKRFLPSSAPFSVHSGVVTVDGHAEGSLSEKRGRAELRAFARNLTVEREGDRFSADLRTQARLVDVSLDRGWGVGNATITADDVAVRLGRGVLSGQLAATVELGPGTWASRTFDLSGSSVSLKTVAVGSKRSEVPVLVVPSLSAVAPRWVLAPSGMDGHVSIDLPGAELGDLARLHELYPLPSGIRIERGAAKVAFHADVDLGSGSVRGDSEFALRGLQARLGSTRFLGDVAGAVKARRSGLTKGTTDFSGSTLAIHHASIGKAVRGEDAWWGKLTLREATLKTSEGIHFTVKAQVTAKDATPATVLVAENTGVPTWAANIFRMPVLHADAEIRVRPASLEVRSLVARGGGTSLRAEYARRGGRQDGAVLMDLGWISLGYDLTDGATGLVLIGSESWFKRKTVTVRDAALAARRKSDAKEQIARYIALTPGLRESEASELAQHCTLDVRRCDDGAVENLLQAALDPCERDRLRGLLYAPLVIAAAKHGTDGTTLDPLVVGSSAEALRTGGESTLDNVPALEGIVAANDPDAARGKLMAVTGHISSIRREGSYSVGTLTTDVAPVYFVTPFAAPDVPETRACFRGVFVQLYAQADSSQSEPKALVLVGVFGH